MDSPCWQILAKAPVEENALGTPNPGGWNGAIWNGVDLDTMRMSLRSFLVDRFKLAAHLEDRLIDGYALTASRPKLKKPNPANRPSCKEGPGDDGKDPRLMAQLDIEYADGSRASIVTNDTWKCAYGPVRQADLIMGAAYDATMEMPGWDNVGFDDSKWQPPVVATAPKIAISSPGATSMGIVKVVA